MTSLSRSDPINPQVLRSTFVGFHESTVTNHQTNLGWEHERYDLGAEKVSSGNGKFWR